MAGENYSNTLENDVLSVIWHSYDIEALLHGALSLLEKFEGQDRDGYVFNARHIIEIAQQKTAQVYGDFDTKNVSERIKALEAVEVCHG